MSPHVTKKRLNSYLHKRLSETEEQEVELHLYSCDDCLTMYMDEVQGLHNEKETDEADLSWLATFPKEMGT
ncbi:zf-HC2 domain-containing protein [Aureibacillus halotolerans]|uniref:Putative zinc finger protein n=1 Tax=Aureibacillus halotolerans TaxID=1508390 RepID=A0A4R6TWL7_9BACI|nr:zf-HC2 domain-containing protein [Aureibacillus halotolerans]TDQ36409.1 putative zinc finger protein [Aureibacillus halotolerans]